MIPLSVCLFLFIELVVVTYFDLKVSKIFNTWAILNLCLFPVLLILFKETYEFGPGTFLIPFTWIIVGFIFFKLNIMGAGDSKYLSSFFLLIPPSLQETMLIDLVFVTIIVGAPLLLYNLYRNIDGIVLGLKMRNYAVLKKYFGKKFTYAPAILAAFLWFIVDNIERVST